MSIPITFVAQVQHGTLALSKGQRERMMKFFQKQEGEYVQLTLRKQGKPRSHEQNNYYHGRVVDILANEFGYQHEEMHEILREKFLTPRFVEFEGKTIAVRHSTTELSTGEFEDYLERIRIWALTEYNVKIPKPHEDM